MEGMYVSINPVSILLQSLPREVPPSEGSAPKINQSSFEKSAPFVPTSGPTDSQEPQKGAKIDLTV